MLKTKFFENVCGTPEEPHRWIYKNEKGMYIREASFKSKKSGTEPVKILSFADVHFNYTNEDDIDNDEIMLTVQHRHWNAGGASVRAARKAMAHAKDFDQTVICGDILDYLCFGAMELMDKYIWNVDSEVICAIGGHELTRQMQTGVPNKDSLDERRDVVRKYWRHDIYYFSKLIKEKVMVVQLDNSCHKYWDCQIEKMENDIKKARENDYIILVFQHEPISTGKLEDSCMDALIVCDRENENFYDKAIGISEKDDEATQKMYELLIGNADVIKGFFCGHVHSGYYTEVNGSYIDESGNIIKTQIPQYVMEGLVYNDYAGHVTEITVV
ncbi:MAG: metallophosphoesterase [Clostridia bacterium]|nr:metallophosphoesterase [Clostridia bacterium]